MPITATGAVLKGGMIIQPTVVPLSGMVLELNMPTNGSDETIAFDGVVNLTVDWGDGNTESQNTTGYVEFTHVYATAGIYTVTIAGNADYWYGVYNGRVRRLVDWGDGLGLIGAIAALYNCDGLVSVPANLPSSLTDISFFFEGISASNSAFANVVTWDISNVTDITKTFLACPNFNQDITSWNTANVTSMQATFNGASTFNQNIGVWNTSNVIDMREVFGGATAFNQNIGSWDTGNVTNMSSMFYLASSFNQNIGAWNTGNVANMYGMFSNATNFNQNLTGWCVTNIPTEPGLFSTGSALTTENKPVWGTCPP